MTPTNRKSLAKIKDSTEFYPHQIEGVRALARHSSFLLADEMGLGKSLQALTVAAIDFERGYASRVLVVAPATLKWNWLEEIEKHTSFTAEVLHGTPTKRATQLDNFKSDILICNYEQITSHQDAFNAMNFDIVILDEAHYIKSPKSKRTKACHLLAGKRFFLLTGSPVLNHVNDLWSLLHRIDPVAYPRYWTFLNRYAVYGGWQAKQIVGIKNEKELRQRVDLVMLRREKKNVLDLPDKQRITVEVDLHPKQAALYKQATEDMLIDLPGDDPLEIENALSKFLRLKQICGTTASFPGYDDFSFKLDRAVEMITEWYDNRHPVVVFTQFRSVLAALGQRLEAAGCMSRNPEYMLHGDVPMQKRQALIAGWTAEARAGRAWPLLAMVQVAGVGLNLTAANRCIFLDKLFSPKMNEQAEDRLHRIGTDKSQPVQIYEMITRGTVEHRVEQILRHKEKLFNGLIANDSQWKRELIKQMAA